TYQGIPTARGHSPGRTLGTAASLLQSIDIEYLSFLVLGSTSFRVTCIVEPGHSQSGQNSTEQLLIQLENEWSRADLNKDPAALDRILAEDWIGIDFEGTVLNKAQALRGIVSDSNALASTVLRDMK